jgi:hypothetical protein
MRVVALSRAALTVSAGAAALASCRGLQPPTTALAASEQDRILTHARRSGSWMEGGAAKWDLLYVSNVNGTVTVYRYWQHKLVGTLTGFSRPKGECVDRDGDVYVTDRVAEDIVEYQHGGVKPVATLKDQGFQDYACSVDPVTGDLAVANSYQADGNAGGIAIYQHARGKPALYKIEHAPNPQTCAYDTHGDLLVASDYMREGEQAVSLVYLPVGSAKFIHLHLSDSGLQPNGVFNVQWDGKYWAILYKGEIARFHIAKDGNSKFEGTTDLVGNEEGESRFWITNFSGNPTKQGTQVVAAQPYNVLYWKYPGGGNSIGSIAKSLDDPYGVAVSLAPDR